MTIGEHPLLLVSSFPPGSDKNRLHAEYGANFQFLGEVKNNLNRVTVVTSIPIPGFCNVK